MDPTTQDMSELISVSSAVGLQPSIRNGSEIWEPVFCLSPAVLHFTFSSCETLFFPFLFSCFSLHFICVYLPLFLLNCLSVHPVCVSVPSHPVSVFLFGALALCTASLLPVWGGEEASSSLLTAGKIGGEAHQPTHHCYSTRIFHVRVVRVRR